MRLDGEIQQQQAAGRGVGASRERGFSLIETVVAMLIMMIAGLGAASLFAYSVNNNSGALDRDMMLALAQQRLEQIRNARFNSTATDAILNGGSTTINVDAAGASPCAANQRCYVLTTAVDNDPSTPAVDAANNTMTRFKRISITIWARTAGPRWASGQGSGITFFTERSRAN